MSSFVLGSVLILVLLVPVVIRIFMKKHTHVDTVVILAPVTIIVLILHVCAFGVQVYTILLAILVLFVVLSNFRSLLRFMNGLYVDYYHVPFLIASVLSILGILFLSVVLVWFAPENDIPFLLTTNDLPSYTETRTMYTGTAYQGLSVRERAVDPVSAVVYTYEPVNLDEEPRPVIVCMPDLCASARDYAPLMKQLAEKGYICMTADIMTKDTAYGLVNGIWIRPFIMRMRRLLDPVQYGQDYEEYLGKKLREAECFISEVKRRYRSRTIIVLTDELYGKLYSAGIEDVKPVQLNLDGIGFLPLTQPLDAACLFPDRYVFADRQELRNRLRQYTNYIIGECR